MKITKPLMRKKALLRNVPTKKATGPEAGCHTNRPDGTAPLRPRLCREGNRVPGYARAAWGFPVGWASLPLQALYRPTVTAWQRRGHRSRALVQLRPCRYRGSPSDGRSQAGASCTQIWSAGAASPGWSRLQSVTSISPGRCALRYVSGVPQRLQKVRRTPGEDANSRGGSPVKVRSPVFTVSQPTAWAADARRQDSQWHNVGGYSTGPQR
jgi:hypothetical protein